MISLERQNTFFIIPHFQPISPKPIHSLNTPFQINPVSVEFCWVPCEPHSAEAEHSPFCSFQPHQLKTVQTTSTSTEDPGPTGGAGPTHSCGMLIKDHLLDYFLVIMIDNEQEITISTNCMANEHQPSEGVLVNLKLAWFIHLPKMPTTATLHSSAYIQIFACNSALKYGR